MEKQLSEILDSILGLLLLEGSYEVEEDEEGFKVEISTKDAGRLIGARGESLEALQLLINQILSKKTQEYKRVILDVEGWKDQKQAELSERAKAWADQVLESGKPMELLPMPAWQRRIIHMTVQEMNGVESESVGEGRDRHLVIKPADAK